MKTLFTELVDKLKLEKQKKEVRVVCDFIEFLKVGVGMKFYVEQNLDNGENGLLPVEMNPEQIDKLLIEFYKTLEGKK